MMPSEWMLLNGYYGNLPESREEVEDVETDSEDED